MLKIAFHGISDPPKVVSAMGQYTRDGRSCLDGCKSKKLDSNALGKQLDALKNKFMDTMKGMFKKKKVDMSASLLAEEEEDPETGVALKNDQVEELTEEQIKEIHRTTFHDVLR
eukprot:CAMPEP_0116900066 /NCGR_PEP_ID=MMETSP0467-20121206/8479_1 /TAXON_ID=283647 /ORGANISM="Mesodinium pulex, Strain SPMC105" /LENGTH=113 /DNA_ID=CAMNT_0004573203 /DNA_START=1602 /DNA_END=1943 /DNA_ORIENTATION=+